MSSMMEPTITSTINKCFTVCIFIFPLNLWMSNFLYQRNLGIGRMLVMKVVEHAKSIGCQRVYLATWRTMYSANALYTKCGFQNIGNRSSKIFFKGLPMKYIFPILGERIPEFILDIWYSYCSWNIFNVWFYKIMCLIYDFV